MRLKDCFKIEHLIVALVTLLLLSLLIFISINIKFLSPVAKAVEEFSLTDLFYQAIQTEQNEIPVNEVTIVNIKDQHDRTILGRTISEITQFSPMVLGVDVIFESELSDSQSNCFLMQSVADCDNYVGASLLKDYNESEQTFESSVSSYFTESINCVEGFTNLNMKDFSGNLRKLKVWESLRGDTIYSLPAEMVASVLGTRESLNSLNERLIDYHPYRFPVVAYDSILQNKDLITNKIVLLGSTEESRDTYFTPIGLKSGVEIQAFCVMTLLSNVCRITVGWLAIFLGSLLCCYLMNVIHYAFVMWAKRRKTPLVVFLSQSRLMLRLLSFGWMGLVSCLAFVVYMNTPYYIPLEYPLAAIVLVSEGRNITIGIMKTIRSVKNDDNYFSKSILMNF